MPMREWEKVQEVLHEETPGLTRWLFQARTSHCAWLRTCLFVGFAEEEASIREITHGKTQIQISH